ncbi:MAG: phenylacetate--CoA ligase family protein [Deltaproteobacteria bacterium]|nr:phenylacetate--CoA ligase family protein [Deltaproteobacteria bacterium]
MADRFFAGFVLASRVVELRRNRFRSPSSLALRNLKRFRRLIQTLAARSPYYSRIIKERRIDPATCAVTDFPALTKKHLLKHFDEIVTDKRITKGGVEAFLSRTKNPLALFKDDFFVVHTSGSNGQIAPFVWHKMDWLRGLTHLARAVPVGIFQKIAFVGATDGHYAGVTMTESSGWGPLWWAHRVKVFDIRKPLSEIVSGLNGYQPCVVVGYATALRALASERAAGRLAIVPRTLISGGEPLVAADKEFIESAFGISITNVYAASEHMIIGIGLPRFGGMVLQEDDLIIEPFEDHTLITNLLNKTLPLIRYKMEDVLLPLEDRQPDWPAYRVVRDVVGRQEYGPQFLNEAGQCDTIHPIVFVEFYVPGLEAFQIIVQDSASFTFLAVPLPGQLKPDLISHISARLDDLLQVKKMRNVKYKVELTDHLPVERSTGKFRLVRSASSEIPG